MPRLISSSDGSSLAATVPPSAKLCAVYPAPAARWVASDVIASTESHSPVEVIAVTVHSRRNAGIASTDDTRCDVGAETCELAGEPMAAHLLVPGRVTGCVRRRWIGG